MLPAQNDDLLADPKLQKIFNASLGELERAYDEDKASGTLDPDLAKVYDSMLEARALEKVDELGGLEPADVVRRVNADVLEGRMSRSFADEVVAPLWAEKERQRRARSLTEAAGGVVQAVRDTGEGSLLRGAVRIGAETVKTLARGAVETGKGIGESVVGTLATGTADTEEDRQVASEVALKGQMKVASGLEGAGRQTLGLLSRFGQAIIPGNSQVEQDVVGVLNRATGGAVPRTAEIGSKLEAGDEKSAWQIALQDSLGAIENSRAEGSLARKLGVNAAELENLGIQVDASDLKAIEDSTEGLSELVEGLASGGAALAFTPVKRGLKVALRAGPAGRKVATLSEKVADLGTKLSGPVESGTLARKAETAAQETERLIQQAERYNTAVKKARVAAGNAAIEFGTFLRQQAGTGLGRNVGLAAAGGAFFSGADPSEVLMAGVAGKLGSSVLTNRFTRQAAGTALQAGGRAIQRDFLPLPLENFRRGLVDFSADYRPVRAAFVGAGAGAVGALPFVIGAETDAEAASSLVSGAGIGAGVGAGQRVRAWGSDALTKRAAAARGETAEMQGPVRPSAPSGVDAEADAINLRAEQDLSQSGLRFIQQLRGFAKSAAGADLFVGQTPEDMAALYQKFFKNPGQAADFNGLFIDAADSTTGRPVVLTKIGTSAGGHEVTHAVMAAAEADPATKPLIDAARVAAARSLGAEFDPKTGKVKYTSPQLDAIREHYMSLDPEGREISWEYALDENIAEHGSVQMSGAPAGKLGGSKGVSKALGDVFVKFADALLGRQPGLAEGGVVTSDVLPYSPSFDLMDRIGEVIRARALENSADIPDASYETVAGQQVRPGDPTASIPVPAGNVQQAPVTITPPPARPGTVDVGVATPVPRDLISTPTPRVRPATGADVGALNPVPTSLLRDPSMGPVAPPARPAEATREVSEEAAPQAAVEATPAGAVRGQKVQAARTNFEAPLTESEKRMVASVQPDPTLRPVAEKLVSHIKALGGQRVGIPVMEMSYKDDTTGVVRSKRVAPYGYEVSSTGKVTIVAADLDRINHNAGLVFEWAAPKGRVLPYTGVSDPAFVADVQTYLRNQAEGRRGSGDPLMVGGAPSTASGEPVARLSREKEQFLSMVMGQAIPAALTPRSLEAIARIRATAQASGVEVLKVPAGAVEPNALRDQLRREGAPIERIGEDPDPTRRQANPAGRNSVVMQMRLPNVQAFAVTGQTISQPNIRAIEASFMPSSPAVPVPPETPRARASNAEVQRVSQAYVSSAGLPYRPHAKAIPVNEDLAKRLADFYDAAVDAPADPAVRQAYQALADETVAQWKAFEADGYTAEPWTGEGQPYANSAEMMADVRDNKHLFYFRTEDGFGSGITPEMRASNPMLAESGVTFGSARNVPVNDVFRVVHDLVGHGAHGYEFGPKGEFNAYLEHSRMFSDAAKPALAAETLAQNSWVNYGPHLRRTDGTLPKKGEDGFVPITQRRFADQKNAVVPADLLAETDAYAAEQTGTAVFMPAKVEDLGTVEQQTARAEEALSLAVPKAEEVQFQPAGKIDSPEFRAWFGKSKVVDDRGRPLVLYRGDRPGKTTFTGREDPTVREDAAGNVFFTNRPSVARFYTRQRTNFMRRPETMREDEGLYRVYVSMQNPLEIDAGGNSWDEIPVPASSALPRSIRGKTMQIDDLASKARAAGFDGLIVRDVLDQAGDGDQFVAFRPEQIKSATGNAGTFDSTNPDIRFQPALAKEKAKGPNVQFKRKAKTGARGGIIDLVHFSSQNLKEIDPKKSFGKGAATPTDRQGMNKVFFYVKGTAYEGPIAVRPNVYEAQVDGNALYDYNEDALGVRSIINREKRDRAIRDAGFVGYFVETEGFDAVAIFEPIKVKASLRQDVMSPRQMRNLGLEPQEPGDLAEEARQERIRALRQTPAYKRAEARIVERVGSRTNGAFFDAMDAWIEGRLASAT